MSTDSGSSKSATPSPSRSKYAALLHEYPLRVGRRGPHFSGRSAGATLTGMKSKVHPRYKTKYRVANWPAYNQGSSQGSVRRRPVYVDDKPSIGSDLRGWITPSASEEELQAPGKVRPTLDGGIARAGQFQGAEQSARMCCNFPKAARERLVESAWLRLMPPPRTSC